MDRDVSNGDIRVNRGAHAGQNDALDETGTRHDQIRHQRQDHQRSGNPRPNRQRALQPAPLFFDGQ